MTWAVGDFYHPDLATWPFGPVENLAEIATEVITSAFECDDWGRSGLRNAILA